MSISSVSLWTLVCSGKLAGWNSMEVQQGMQRDHCIFETLKHTVLSACNELPAVWRMTLFDANIHLALSTTNLSRPKRTQACGQYGLLIEAFYSDHTSAIIFARLSVAIHKKALNYQIREALHSQCLT